MTAMQFFVIASEDNMKPIDLESIRKRLESDRRESMQTLLQLGRETRSPDPDNTQDSADLSTTNTSKELLFERSSQRRTMLRLIEAALQRIADGSFGACVSCGDDIPLRRLQALPWTQFCLRCQEEIEREVGSNLSARVEIPLPRLAKRAG
jgi:DnaK suppressor protein